MRLSLFLVIAFGLLTIQSLPQKTRDVKVREGDSFIHARIKLKQKRCRPNTNSMYMWYMQQAIFENRGGYYGKLLHGPYRRFDEKSRLVEYGNLRNGRKKGKWLHWNDTGNITLIARWRRGMKHGDWVYYEAGRPVEIKKYAKGDFIEKESCDKLEQKNDIWSFLKWGNKSDTTEVH